jgi:hypothetical protein
MVHKSLPLLGVELANGDGGDDRFHGGSSINQTTFVPWSAW